MLFLFARISSSDFIAGFVQDYLDRHPRRSALDPLGLFHEQPKVITKAASENLLIQGKFSLGSIGIHGAITKSGAKSKVIINEKPIKDPYRFVPRFLIPLFRKPTFMVPYKVDAVQPHPQPIKPQPQPIRTQQRETIYQLDPRTANHNEIDAN